ncbi:NAD(P)-binding protein [Mycena galericulata]|nr:NAD(P)-binding protein [Mycena galericulata]
MPSSRIVAVFGATGLQGSAVLEAILKDGTFTPRAITRNPDSENALKLKARGVEVVQADSGDKESLMGALKGSEGVFAYTVPKFAPVNTTGPEELTQGKNIVDAAKQASVKFLVFSSVPSIKKLSDGKYANVSPYEALYTAAISEYLRVSGLPHANKPAILLEVRRPRSTGFSYTVAKYSPTALRAITWVQHDVGEAAVALLRNYTDPAKDVLGKSYPVVTANMTGPDIAALASQALGVKVTFNSIASTGIPILDEMFAAQSEYDGFYTATPVPNPDLVSLGAKFGTLEEFMQTEVKKRFGQ